MSKRRLFVTKEFEAWAKSLGTDRQPQRLLSYAAELETLAADFVAGERVATFMTRVDPPTGLGIMRVKTTSNMSLIGWAPEDQAVPTLILAVGAKANETHGGRKLTALGREVVKARQNMGVSTWAKGEYYELFQYQN